MLSLFTHHNIANKIFSYLQISDIRSLAIVSTVGRHDKFSRLVLTKLLSLNSIKEPPQKCKMCPPQVLYCENCDCGYKQEKCVECKEFTCRDHFVDNTKYCINCWKENIKRKQKSLKKYNCNNCNKELNSSLISTNDTICYRCRLDYYCGECGRQCERGKNKCMKCFKAGCDSCSGDFKEIDCMGNVCKSCYYITMNYRHECKICHEKTVRCCNCGSNHCDNCGHNSMIDYSTYSNITY